MEYRLNKYISDSGYCSRREADRFIESGNVTVNGKRAIIGDRVLPGQKVRVNGNLIESGVEPVYIAFNKPVGVVSTTDPLEKDNIVDFICHEQRIFPIGRLDKDSQGLILLTNDGDIVNKVLRAGNNHKKLYTVTVNKPITPDFLTRMANGVPVLDRVTRKCTLEQINSYTFKISLIQGLNRQIRRMCEYFGYEVTKLERTQVMNITLDKLGQGNWRNLTIEELAGLFDMLEGSEKIAPVDPKPKPKLQAKAPTVKAVGTTREEKLLEEKENKGVKSYSKPKPKDSRSAAPTKSKSKSAGSGQRIGKQRVDKDKDKDRSKWNRRW